MDDATSELHELLKGHGSALPVLFVGSGLSRRYIGSPNWHDLLARFATLAGRSMPYYLASASEDLPQVATLIAGDFFEVWFSDDLYKQSRAEFEDQVKRRSDPLKFEITKYLDGLTVVDDEDAQNELAALSKIHAQAIITTNWDEILETALPEFEVFIGQNDVLFTTLQSVGEIYKIHGSITDPQSVVLTSEDYIDYWKRNPYLISKMLTLFVEHPVIFFGYSVSDPHIRKMLTDLVDCLTSDQLQVLNDRLIFVKPGTGKPKFLSGTLTVPDHSISIREYIAQDFTELYKCLGGLPRRFPPKLMRQLKESVYKLAYDSTSQGRVHVLPIDQDADLEKLEAIIGVGTMDRLGEKGYGHFSREDLILDMLMDANDHNSEAMLKRLVPEIFTLVKYAPIYYPLSLCGRVNDYGKVAQTADLPRKARALIDDPLLIEGNVSNESPRRNQQFSHLLAAGEKVAMNYGTVCAFDTLEEVILLRDFLHALINRQRKTTTQIAMLASRYDRLVYGREYEGDRDLLAAALLKPPGTTHEALVPR